MRVALRPNITRQRVSGSASIPAPIRGWNAVDPLANMKPEFATEMVNWIPRPGFIELRRGHVVYGNTAVAARVESLMAYHGLTANKLFAAVSTFIFNVTAEGAPVQDLATLANARWQHVNFATTGANYLWICNGQDTPRTYNGSAWGTAVITGITSTDIVNVAVHKNRLWFVRTGTLNAAYLPVDSFQGVAAAFPLNGVFTKGGVLMAIATWSIDGGSGQDDMLAFITSRGQVAVYSGVDPASATDFVLRGVYDIAPPIGRRCVLKVGGDLAVLTIDGVVPLSRALVTDRAASETVALTQRIQPVMNQSARDWNANFGWQMVAYPRATLAILNVPISEGVQQVQYCMNTLTGAWCKFTGWNANCFEIFNDRLFFGGNDGKVYEADRSGSDNGQPIDLDVRFAFSYFGSRGTLKNWKMVRPVLTTDGAVTPSIGLNVDFRDNAALSTPSSLVVPGARFDAANFDVAVFPIELRTQARWAVTTGVGYCASFRMRAQVAASGSAAAEQAPVTLKLNAVDFIYETGGLM